MNETLFERTVSKSELKKDLDHFFNVARACMCHCYDHTNGLYPDDCDCEDRERVSEAMSALTGEHERLVRKYHD